MAVDPRSVKISSPCPIDLDPDRHKAGKASWYCDHCEKSVHILSNMTEKEARQLMADREGEKICISYAVKANGKVRFRAETATAPFPSNLVPVSALLGGRKVAAAAAVGFTAALAACTPHENPNVEKQEVVIDHDIEPMPAGGIQAIPIEPDPVIEGEIEAKPVDDTIFDGEAIPVGSDEPCDKSKEPVVDDTAHERGEMAPQPDQLMVPGQMVAEPIEPPPKPAEEIVVDGGMEAIEIPAEVAQPDTMPKPGGMIARPVSDE